MSRDKKESFTKCLLALVLLAQTIFLLSVLATPVNAYVNCTFVGAATCTGTSTRFLGAQNDTGGWQNAHAELSSQSNYANSDCCNASGTTLNTTCGTTALHLESTTNAHVEQTNESAYAQNACFGSTNGTITCQYADTSCPAGYGCVLTMANADGVAGGDSINAHIGDCTAAGYTRRLCCKSNAAPTQGTPILNASDNPLNRTMAVLTAWNQSTYDADSNAITNIYSFKLNGTSIAVLLLPFDSNINSVASGAVRDYARGNNATLMNSPTWTSSGTTGGAYSFNGNNSYVEVPHQSYLNYTGGVMTLMAWIKPTTTELDTGYIISKPWNSGGDYNYRVAYNANTVSVSLRGNASYTSSSVAVQNNSWTHIAVVLASGNVLIYTNGTLQLNQSHSIVNWTPSSGGSGLNMAIGSLYPYGGAWSGNTAFTFNGSIDDVRIYNRSLTSAQINELFNESKNLINTSSIVPEETFKNDTWTVEVTPNDGALDGTTLTSNNVTILNSPPNAMSLLLPLNNNNSVSTRYPTFTWTTTDNDSDVVTYFWNLSSPTSCAAIPQKNFTTTSYISIDKLCVDKTYNWTMNACDPENACSAWASQFNFTVPSVVGVTFINSSVNFGTLASSLPGSDVTNNTLTNNPYPLRYNNTGNVDASIQTKANAALWSAQPLSTLYFQYSDENSSSWQNWTSGYTSLFGNLSNPAMTRELEVRIQVPIGEAPGTKNTTIMVLGASIE